MTYSGRTALGFNRAPHVISICLQPEEGRSTYLCNLSVATKLRRCLIPEDNIFSVKCRIGWAAERTHRWPIACTLPAPSLLTLRSEYDNMSSDSYEWDMTCPP